MNTAKLPVLTEAEKRELLARVVYAESNTEPLEGQIAVAQVVLNRLFAQTQLQITFAINMLALVNNQSQPRILSLRHILDEYLAFQEEVILSLIHISEPTRP